MSTLEAEQRRHGRLNCSLLDCHLGTVVDFSRSGLRVRCRRRQPEPGELVLLKLTCFGLSFKVWARVIWVKKSGLFRHDVGMSFVEVSPQLAFKINEIARVAVDRHVISRSPVID